MGRKFLATMTDDSESKNCELINYAAFRFVGHAKIQKNSVYLKPFLSYTRGKCGLYIRFKKV